MFLDYGYRSKCCHAPIRLGNKSVKKTNLSIKVWVCCKCGSRNVDIIPSSGEPMQANSRPFVDD